VSPLYDSHSLPLNAWVNVYGKRATVAERWRLQEVMRLLGYAIGGKIWP